MKVKVKFCAEQTRTLVEPARVSTVLFVFNGAGLLLFSPQERPLKQTNRNKQTNIATNKQGHKQASKQNKQK